MPLENDAAGEVTPVSATSLPLPTGAATSSLQTTGNTSVASIDTKLIADTAFFSGTLQVAGNTDINVTGYEAAAIFIGTHGKDINTSIANSIQLYASDGTHFQLTYAFSPFDLDGQPISIIDKEGMYNVQVGGLTTLRITNGGLIPYSVRLTKGSVLDVAIEAVQFVSAVGNFPVTAASLPLPTGASTSSLQTTGNTSLSSLDTKTPAKGTALIAGSTPVNIASDQTVPVSLASVPSHAVTNAGTFAVQATLAASSAVVGHVIVDTAPSTAVTNAGTFATQATLAAETTKVIGTVNVAAAQSIAATQSGTWTVQPGNTANTTAWKVDGSAVTQPVSIATAPALVASTAVIGKVGIDQTTPGTTNKVSIGTDGTVAVTNLDVALSTRLKPADTLTGVTTVGTVSAVTAITNALPAGTNVIGKTSIDQTTPGTTNLVALTAETTKVIGTVNVAAAQTIAVTQATAASLNATVTPIAITKGSQGATGFTTQDLKDAGRNQTNFFMAIQIVSTGTDALMSLTGYKAGAAVGATTTPAVVTSGKTFRINSITMDYTTIVTTPGSVRFTLRANTGGVVAITSPAVQIWEVGEPTGIAPVAGKKNTVTVSFPEGIEFAAGTGIGISMVGLNTVGAAAAVGYGRISINGFEY